MNKRRILYVIPVILFGLFMFVFGGFDDSPGAQVIGLVAVLAGVVGVRVIESMKKKSKTGSKE